MKSVLPIGSWKLALATLATLAAFNVSGYQRETVHALPMRGVVTWSRGFDKYFFIVADDGSGPWRIDCAPARPRYKIGDIVEVLSGEAKATYTTPRVNHAACNLIGHDDEKIPPPLNVTIADLYRHPLNDPAAPDLWGLPVATAGIVRDINRRETFTQIQISDGERSFQAAIPVHVDKPLPDRLKLGAKVQVEGIMVYTPIDDSKTHTMVDFNNVSILPPSAEFVRVIARAPFWTPDRLALLIGAILSVLFVALVWVALLRRAVALKAAQLEVTLREKVRDKVEADAIRRERLRFSYELHDNFQQLLASCRFRLEALDLMLPEKAVAERAQLEKAQTALDYTQHGLRTALWGMTEECEGPKSFTGLLKFAMGRMAHWENIVFLTVEGEEPPGARKFAGLMLMVLQEAVGNALKHGKATKVDVRLVFSKDALDISISDNGIGFNSSQSFGSDHLGLPGMKMRVASCGGKFSIQSTPGRGTVISVSLPVAD